MGNGITGVLIGNIDNTFNGQSGKNLRFNFIQNQYENNDFQSGTLYSTSIPGWTSYLGQVLLNGNSIIAGWPTPNDTTAAPDGGIESTYNISSNQYFRVLNNPTQNVPYVINTTFITLTPNIVNNPNNSGGVIHGPALYSNSPVKLSSGDNISFTWFGVSSNNYGYDIFSYLIDVNNGNTQILNNYTSDQGNSGYKYINNTVTQDGYYKFVFIGGAWNSKFSTAGRSTIWLDDIIITSNKLQNLDNTQISALTSLVSYQNTSSVSVSAKVNNIDVSATNAASVQDARNTVAAKIQALIDNGTLTNATLTANGDTLQLKSTQAGQNINIQLSDSNDARVVATTLTADPIPVRPFVDLTSSKQANFALTKIDAALDKVSNIRSAAGGYSNLFAAVADQKSNEAQSVTMARSKLADTDFDKESAQLLKSKIVKMGAAAMLSQATSNLKLMMTILKMPASFDFHLKAL